jgi:hypothetical protein
VSSISAALTTELIGPFGPQPLFTNDYPPENALLRTRPEVPPAFFADLAGRHNSRGAIAALRVNNGPDRAETGLPKCPIERTFTVLVGMSRTCQKQKKLNLCCSCGRE